MTFNHAAKNFVFLITVASLIQLVNVPAPVFQNYLDDPNYVWNPSVIPVPPKPRPI